MLYLRPVKPIQQRRVYENRRLVNAVIGSVIINELISPPLVKYALLKAGETHTAEDEL
jgi:hypothetical protein